MNFKNSLFALALIGSSAVIAHDHHNSSKEKLVEALVSAEIMLDRQEKVIKNYAEQNQNLTKQVACLQAVLHELKHHLHEKHPFHELIKALAHLKKSISL